MHIYKKCKPCVLHFLLQQSFYPHTIVVVLLMGARHLLSCRGGVIRAEQSIGTTCWLLLSPLPPPAVSAIIS